MCRRSQKKSNLLKGPERSTSSRSNSSENWKTVSKNVVFFLHLSSGRRRRSGTKGSLKGLCGVWGISKGSVGSLMGLCRLSKGSLRVCGVSDGSEGSLKGSDGSPKVLRGLWWVWGISEESNLRPVKPVNKPEVSPQGSGPFSSFCRHFEFLFSLFGFFASSQLASNSQADDHQQKVLVPCGIRPNPSGPLSKVPNSRPGFPQSDWTMSNSQLSGVAATPPHPL